MLINYMYADVFDGFSMFFGKYNQGLLVDVGLGLKSRQFIKQDILRDEMIIQDEDQEVSEMYFLMQGNVGIGFYQFN